MAAPSLSLSLQVAPKYGTDVPPMVITPNRIGFQRDLQCRGLR
jgi:hypothetical protein